MPTAHILIVDDEINFLHFVTEILIGAGYDAVGCSDPTQAVKLAATFKPDVVILDVSMPKKDGFQIAKELRRDPKTSAARIMFLTAHRAATNVKRAKAAGGIAYLEKPVRSSSLLWMIKALLSEGPGRKAKIL